MSPLAGGLLARNRTASVIKGLGSQSFEAMAWVVLSRAGSRLRSAAESLLLSGLPTEVPPPPSTTTTLWHHSGVREPRQCPVSAQPTRCWVQRKNYPLIQVKPLYPSLKVPTLEELPMLKAGSPAFTFLCPCFSLTDTYSVSKERKFWNPGSTEQPQACFLGLSVLLFLSLRQFHDNRFFVSCS